MKSVFLWFFEPPKFYNEDDARVARLLSVAIFIILLIAFVRTVYAFTTQLAGYMEIIVVNSAIFVLFGASFTLMRFGYVRIASIALTASQWVITAGIVYQFGGVSVSNYSIFIFVIFVSGLLLGGRWAIGYAALSVAYGSFMLYLESIGAIASMVETGNLGFVVVTPSFVTTAVLVYLYDHNIKQALFRARANEQAMIEHSHQLELTNARVAEEMEERRKLEERLLQSQKLEAIGHLSGGIAHDLNNLIVPIMGYVELSLMQVPDDQKKMQRNLLQIKKGAERATALTKQILAFSRKQMLQVAAFNPDEVIQSFEKMIARLITENIDVQTSFNPEKTMVLADKTQFEQVLMNLVINARDAMPDGGRISISTQDVYVDDSYPEVQQGELSVGAYVVIAVSDTGHGMDTATIRQIFDPFFTTKEMGKGTGLGLSTVFGIVKQHNGHVWVYSEVDHGTTFKVYWPQATQKISPDADVDLESVSSDGSEVILVVEDNEMVRDFVSEALETFGYTVVLPGSPKNAIQAAIDSAYAIDLVLTDVVMPNVNGREVHEKIVQVNPDVKVLYMSGYTDDIISYHGLEEHGLNFLPKPFSIIDLTKKVRQVLDH